MGWAHKREHYRVAYPATLRPRFEVQAHPFEVIDVCERGLRFSLGDAAPPEAGFEVRGAVRFRSGETVEVSGVVVRVDHGEVALRLDSRIPLRVIRAEQRLLLDRSRPPSS